MIRPRNLVALLATTAGLLTASPAFAGWQNSFSGFGATLQGDLYTPSTLASPPGILVAIHMCTGHSSTVHGWFDSYADKNGFYIIAPDAGKQCFDASASRDGDKAAIVKMVTYLLSKGADKTRVFAAGMSSGGCMTNTLLAIYPDVFAGGSAMPGFPAGGWPAGDIMCTKCGSQPPGNTAQQWGDIARKVFSWSGTYPCSQQWVGGGDQYNFNGWLPSVAAQFSNLSNLGSGMSGTGAPSGWTRTVYKDSAGNIRLETNLGPSSQMHDLETVNPPLYGNVITFLGLDKPTGACGLATSSTGAGGGTAAGGASGGGGAKGNGGATGGGGTKGNGGATGSSSGGTTGSSSGGTTGSSSGGTTGSSSGGTTGSSSGGSSSSSGGTTASGGRTSSGGSSASGGSSSGGSNGNGSGGSSSSGSGGSGTGDNGSSGGCSVAGGPQGGTLAMLLFVGLGLVMRRRSRSRR